MATHSPTDPLVLAIDVPPLAEARAAFLDHQAKRPRLSSSRALPDEIKAYDQALAVWLATKEKLSLRLELAQAQDRGAWKPCALPDHPCPQPEPEPAPRPATSRPLLLTHTPIPPNPQEAPVAKRLYAKGTSPQNQFAHQLAIFRAAKSVSSQNNARGRLHKLCREHGFDMPADIKVRLGSRKPATSDRVVFKPASKPTACPPNKHPQIPQPTVPIQPLSATAAPYTHEISAALATSQATLLRMRKEGWLLLAATETLANTERQALVHTIEMVRGQLDMALSLARGAA